MNFIFSLVLLLFFIATALPVRKVLAEVSRQFNCYFAMFLIFQIHNPNNWSDITDQKDKTELDCTCESV